MNLSLNILSLFRIVVSFGFNLYIGRIFGLGGEIDIYFSSMILMVYFGYLLQIFHESIGPYYIEKKIKNQSEKLYQETLSNIFLGGALLCITINLLAPFISEVYFKNEAAINFFKVFSFVIILQNIDLFNRSILNLNKKYKVPFLSDIFLNVINVVGLIILTNIFNKNIIFIAYIYILSYLLLILIQFYLINKKIGYSYRFRISLKENKEIIINSLYLKIGSYAYGTKEIIISKMLLMAGPGVYSEYVYAQKFLVALFLVINTPVIGVFNTKIQYIIANRKIDKIKNEIKKVFLFTVSLWLIGVLISYLIIPYLLENLMNLSKEESRRIMNVYILLIPIYFFMVIEGPFSRILNALKKFKITLKINIYFILIFSILIFIGIKILDIDILYTIIISYIIGQLSNCVCYYINYKKNIKEIKYEN